MESGRGSHGLWDTAEAAAGLEAAATCTEALANRVRRVVVFVVSWFSPVYTPTPTAKPTPHTTLLRTSVLGPPPSAAQALMATPLPAAQALQAGTDDAALGDARRFASRCRSLASLAVATTQFVALGKVGIGWLGEWGEGASSLVPLC